jgi:hypothetical protein
MRQKGYMKRCVMLTCVCIVLILTCVCIVLMLTCVCTS